jgi:4-hydroxythreonine-4-phosphate dehydrogenase
LADHCLPGMRHILQTDSPLVITQGDPAGVGPELVLDLWARRAELGLPPFAFIGSFEAMQRRIAQTGHAIPLARIGAPADALACFDTALPVIDHGLPAEVKAGQPDAGTAAGTIEAIRVAAAFVLTGEAAAMVTNPIAKSVLYSVGFKWPGHTEYLAALAKQDGASEPFPVMLIWSEALAVVPVTIHIPLKDVARRLTADLIIRTGVIVDRAYRDWFGIAAPRLVLAGLNPHAGEQGTIGHEDDAVVAPAVAELQRRGIDARGPLSADTLFHARARATYDVALTMYHDQGLIPAKTLAFDDGVNVTLGLPFIRTSPDHGTAFDIAGQGIARADSLLAAVRLARRLADRRSA